MQPNSRADSLFGGAVWRVEQLSLPPRVMRWRRQGRLKRRKALCDELASIKSVRTLQTKYAPARERETPGGRRPSAQGRPGGSLRGLARQPQRLIQLQVLAAEIE